MGGADIVPGVSGGTVALILGIYERLINAISRIDGTFFVMFFRGKWKSAANHIDARFLLTLACGIGIGIAALASLMHTLLNDFPKPTLAVFFGLILASTVFVFRGVRSQSVGTFLLATLGCVAAYQLVGLDALKNPPEAQWYVLVCGTIAITAMILPGISGAFILLLLGQYARITGIIKETVKGNITGENLIVLGLFAVGCFIGLMLLSRVLKWLLANFHDATLAVLTGVMLGSLRKLWPFKDELSNAAEFKDKEFENTAPALDSESFVLLALILVAAGLVLSIDWWARRKPPKSEGA